MQADSPNRIPFLDGIRGYASLWVMLGHFSTRTGVSLPIINSPGIAVDLFMIVSGFLMTQHFFVRQASEPWEAPRTWLIFYLRRFFRIAPLYYTLLIPSFLAFYSLQDAQRGALKKLLNVEYHPSVHANAANVLAHISFLFGLIPKYCTALAMPDWSLGLEIQFYAMFPFMMILARRLSIFRFWLIAFLGWVGFRRLSGTAVKPGSFFELFSLPSFFPLKLGLFLIGVLLAWAWMQEKRKLTPRASVLLLLMALTAACARDQATAAPTSLIVTAVSILCALLLFCEEALTGFGLERWVQKIGAFLGNRVSHFFANVSYGVYLLHTLIMIPLLAILCEIPLFIHQRPLVRFLVLTGIAGPITYGLAWILFRVVETPGVLAGRSLIGRFLEKTHDQRLCVNPVAVRH